MVPGIWFPVDGSQNMVPGIYAYRLMVPSKWFLVYGSCYMVPGIWLPVDGSQYMVPII